MMVGVPVLLVACDSACVPLTWVMAVAVGVSWWCVFQWCVAVVLASSVVPGVVLGFGVWVACFGVGWLVSGVCGVCAGVVWLVLVGVCWLVCVVWFRMLTCLASFFFLGFVFCFVLLFG